MYLPISYKIDYDTKKFPFKKIISNILEIKELDLENLHLLEDYGLLSREQDQKTKWHKKYYDKFKTEFCFTYLKLIKELKERFEYKEIIYQQIPTFRVQLGNGNVAVGEWHKDKTYEHGTTEVNFWMPFTNTNSFNSVWIESSEDKGDYKPHLVNYGEILVFNGANLTHGNKKNESNETRVSIDFRLVDCNKFTPNSKGSINMNAAFDIGGYFNKL
jgi:ectoine hydroxylase-related dioxygenase (phytanoyl-CoA dioxygenase family)